MFGLVNGGEDLGCTTCTLLCEEKDYNSHLETCKTCKQKFCPEEMKKHLETHPRTPCCNKKIISEAMYKKLTALAHYNCFNCKKQICMKCVSDHLNCKKQDADVKMATNSANSTNSTNSTDTTNWPKYSAEFLFATVKCKDHNKNRITIGELRACPKCRLFRL